MTNSVDADQTAPWAVWPPGSTMFAQTCLSENLESLVEHYIGFSKVGFQCKEVELSRADSRYFLHTGQGFPQFSLVLTNLILHTLIQPVR